MTGKTKRRNSFCSHSSAEPFRPLKGKSLRSNKMNYLKVRGFVFVFISLFLLTSFNKDWGFFAHRRINRMAVFTLPPEMMIFYKKNIEYLTEHAVDADKRRYATKHEAVRHYIDIDRWGAYPFSNLPRNWTEVLIKHTKLFIVNGQNDTLQVFDNELIKDVNEELVLTGGLIPSIFNSSEISISYKKYSSFFFNNIQKIYYEDDWIIDCDSLKSVFGELASNIDCNSVFATDHFSEHGILPYHLVHTQNRLTKAFEMKDEKQILQLSADIGHYIGDAHVPLHTTENYNGQLTDQLGIHAFWESRIPELFADIEFDYFVGKAEYIENPSDFYWDIVLSSNALVDSVLLIEKELSQTFPQDKQYCFDQRGETTVRTQCEAYATAYKKRMNGMVEERMKGSIHSIGSAWYSAWVNAGQPDLSNFKASDKNEMLKAQKEKEDDAPRGQIKGREH